MQDGPIFTFACGVAFAVRDSDGEIREKINGKSDSPQRVESISRSMFTFILRQTYTPNITLGFVIDECETKGVERGSGLTMR